MNALTKKRYFRFLALMLMITTYLPVLTNNMPSIIRSHHAWAAIWGFSLLIFSIQVMRKKLLISVLIYAAIFSLFLLTILWGNVDEWNKGLVQNEAYMIVVASSMLAYFWGTKDFHGLAWLMKWTLLFIGITSVMTIYSSIIDPLYARKLISGAIDEVDEVIKFGGGSYGTAGALLLLLPVIIYYYKNSKDIPFSKPLILSFGILCFVALVRMQLFANILLGVFVIVFSVLSKGNIARSIPNALIILFVLVIAVPYLPEILFSIGGLFSSDSDIYFKLNDLALFSKYGADFGDTSISGRADRYPVLFEALKSGPLLGVFISNEGLYDGAGAHLYWINKLTVFGILGFLPFVYLIYLYLKECINNFESGFLLYFIFSILTGIALGFVKNLAGREFWYMFFFVLPGLYWLPLLKREKNKPDHS